MSIRLNSEEQESLVIENRALVYHLVKKMNIMPSDYEDIISIGTVGLVKAAATYDKSRKINFATYACRCINNEIYMYFRKEKWHLKDISLENAISVDLEGNEMTLKEAISSTNGEFEKEILERENFIYIINIILNCFKEKERSVILYRLSGMNQRAIAENLNVSPGYISKIEKRVKDKIKVYLSKENQYNRIFSMNIKDDLYRISFNLNDFKDCNQIYEILLQKWPNGTGLSYFKFNYENKRIIVELLAYPESFVFIAQIIQEIENYSDQNDTFEKQ